MGRNTVSPYAAQLPLLGSNQDSSDPESARFGSPGREVASKHSEVAPKQDRTSRDSFRDFSRDRDIERLVPIARELARRAAEHGVTVEDLRVTAVARAVLTGEEKGRRLSYLGVVMRKAGLVATGQYKRSGVEKSHGNLHMIWVAEQYRQAVA